MQAKLGASFLMVALLYVLVGLAVPRLGMDAMPATLLAASSYLVIGLGAAWALSRRLGLRTRRLADAARIIRQGDLTARVEIGGRDEIAEVASAFAMMTESLRRIVLAVHGTAERIEACSTALSSSGEDLHAATSEIEGTTRKIARGVEDQTETLGKMTDSARDLAAVVQAVTDRAQEVNRSATDATLRAAGGGDDARKAGVEIEILTEKNVTATDAVEGFRDKAGHIDNLINSIRTISHQTHLLAINAAIEAARAGDEGRGFAVVAEEVSRLADNVRQFAEQISSISEEITDRSGVVANQIRHSVQAAEEVADTVAHTLASFEGILSATRGTADHSGEILELSQTQRDVAETIEAALQRVSRTADANARETEEATTAMRGQSLSVKQMGQKIQELADESRRLRELVSTFRLH